MVVRGELVVAACGDPLPTDDRFAVRALNVDTGRRGQRERGKINQREDKPARARLFQVCVCSATGSATGHEAPDAERIAISAHGDPLPYGQPNATNEKWPRREHRRSPTFPSFVRSRRCGRSASRVAHVPERVGTALAASTVTVAVAVFVGGQPGSWRGLEIHRRQWRCVKTSCGDGPAWTYGAEDCPVDPSIRLKPSTSVANAIVSPAKSVVSIGHSCMVTDDAASASACAASPAV